MNCIYGANFRISPMETAESTGVYGGPLETPKTATLLAKSEPEGEDWRVVLSTPPTDGAVTVCPPTRFVHQQLAPSRCQPDENYCLLISYPVTTVVGRYFSRSVRACRSIDRQNHLTLLESGYNGHVAEKTSHNHSDPEGPILISLLQSTKGRNGRGQERG